MSNHYLQTAKAFIQDRDFDSARKVLDKIPHHPIAQKWLARLDELEKKGTNLDQKLQAVQLSVRLEAIMRKHISKDEVVLWYEQPDPVIYSQYMTPNWLKAILWGGGGGLFLVWIYIQFFLIKDKITATFLLQIATPLILMAVPFIRIVLSQQRARAIHYIVTDHRGFIVEKLKVRTIPHRYLLDNEVVTERVGLESLVFKRHSSFDTLFGFVGIADADKVKKLISKYHHPKVRRNEV